MDITTVGYFFLAASALGFLAMLGHRFGGAVPKDGEEPKPQAVETPVETAPPATAAPSVVRPPRPTDPAMTASRGGSRPAPSSSLGSSKTRPAASRAPRVHPTQVGPYAILGLVGEGAMATVYKAEDPDTKQVVALKLVQEGLQKDPEFVARFQREMEISQKLVHPNIVKIYRSGAQPDGQLYMTMELIDGQNLDEMLKAGPLPLSQVGRIAGQLVDGLHYAHQRDLVHRDIKPSNIMVTKNGIPKLLDFGLALQQGMNRFTTVGASMGTPTHMAPETLTTGNSDKKSDQYALGICIFQMLTGVCPFTGPDAMSIAMQHVKSPPPSIRALRDEVPPRLEVIVNRMLKKAPEERYPTLTQLQMEIVASV